MLQKNKMNQQSFNETVKSIQEMQTWIRKIEQTTMSVSTRLNAIEQRLSAQTRLSHPQWYNTDDEMRTDSSDKIDIKDISTVKSLLTDQSVQLHLLQSQRDQSKKTISELHHQLNTMQQSVDRMQECINTKMENHNKNAVLMKIKGREIPLEISGIIGGVLALCIAILIGVGGKNIVVSPLFLALIGAILIVSSLLRSFNLSFFMKKLLSKTS